MVDAPVLQNSFRRNSGIDRNANSHIIVHYLKSQWGLMGIRRRFQPGFIAALSACNCRRPNPPVPSEGIAKELAEVVKLMS
ncbi:hypothetical protein Zmor_013564 [Zophobas morio]|uniref:Uncharacterized protein n=1 Tax=Zophobas morio TaxID=2755281 RepID=A0AA38IHV8_9CUCU|nr:hypothetical protein Zmor_013564 [Zophobas morio]